MARPREGGPRPRDAGEALRHRILRLLLDEGAIGEVVVANLLAWPHTGFGAHVSRAIPADHRTPEIVARYMTRAPIAPERILGDGATPKVIYRSDVSHPRHQANFRALAPLDFLAEVSAHIPDPHQKTTIFYGWYSNRSAELATKPDPGISEGAGPASAGRIGPPDSTPCRCGAAGGAPSWARLGYKGYEVDPLLCPRCGA